MPHPDFVFSGSFVQASWVSARGNEDRHLDREPVGRGQAQATMAHWAQFTPFDIGQIKAHAFHGLGPVEIAGLVKKSDRSRPTHTAVSYVLARLKQNPKWRGERLPSSGRPRATGSVLDKNIVAEVMKFRGKIPVTIARLRKKFPAARRVQRHTLERRLHEAGLRWMRRRRKTIVPDMFRKPRVHWAKWVLRCQARSLRRWVYTDGTVFFLDKTEVEHESTKRAALGSSVWRMADCSDALYADCIGPSKYVKAQGLPIRVWGLLVNGELKVTILPPGAVMNRLRYTGIIQTKFAEWLEAVDRPMLVQDHERCLHCSEPLAALIENNIQLVTQHPKYSADLNPIENAWHLLRQRMQATEPTHLEDRWSFCRRIRRAVEWINENQRDALTSLCRNQKQRAEDVLRQKGSRTTW